jgi:hypothetical protein
MLVIIVFILNFVSGFFLFKYNYIYLNNNYCHEVYILVDNDINIDENIELFLRFMLTEISSNWTLEVYKYLNNEILLYDLFVYNFWNTCIYVNDYIYTHFILLFWHLLVKWFFFTFDINYLIDENLTNISDVDSSHDLFVMWAQMISVAILTIWARGVGPRFRPDQMSELTWKDILIYLIGCLLFLFLVILLG